jgi:hypothetical protein
MILERDIVLVVALELANCIAVTGRWLQSFDPGCVRCLVTRDLYEQGRFRTVLCCPFARNQSM